MYLSRVRLNPNLRETKKALSTPHILHGAVERGFASKSNRNLWRVDVLNGTYYLLVLSREKPDFTHIAEQFGYPSLEPLWETKDYNLLLARLKEGQVWFFCLRANPTRSSFHEKDSKTERGKVFAHVTTEQQRQWLLSRSASLVFKLEDNQFDVVQTQWLRFQKGKNSNQQVTLRTAVFEGKLIITDLERFRHTLLNGIGRAKAYGCGLLTIAR